MDMALQLLVAVLIGLTLSSLPQSECYQPKQGVADGKELLACPPPSSLDTKFRFTMRFPEDCNRTDCEYFIGINTNTNDDRFIDITLMGNETGWIAVGFTKTASMFDAYTIGCNKYSDNVSVIESHNPSKPHRDNILDDSQDDVCPHLIVLEDGRFDCRFSRAIVPSSKDSINYSLDEKFYLLMGKGPKTQNDSTKGFTYHSDGKPKISEKMINPAKHRDGPLPCPSPSNFSTTFRLTKGFPEGCNYTNCNYFLGINTNSYDDGFLDIILMGNATGWIAVGFTKTPSMYDTNVIGCNKYADNVSVIESHNPSKPHRNNLLDESQDDVCPVSVQFEDGRFECRFSRAIVPSSNASTHYPLDEDYYLLMGKGPQQQDDPTLGFTFHLSETPKISEKMFDPSKDGGPINATSTALREALIKVHGVLMIVAWPMIAGVGVFFSAFMKTALQGGVWFQVHRAFMLTSLVLASISFALIFVANKDSDTPGIMNDLSTANPIPMSHFVIGVAVMLLHFVNPIIALFRCKPTDRFRLIFNIVHGKFIGYFALILALTNIALGIFIHTNSSYSNPSFGLHLGVSGCGIIVFIVSHLYYNIVPRLVQNKQPEEEYALLPKKPALSSSFCLPGESNDKGIQDSQGAGGLSRIHIMLWATLVLVLVVLVPAMIAECVFITITTPSTGN